MMLLSNFLTLTYLSILIIGPSSMSVSSLVWDYENRLLQGIDQKFGSQKRHLLSFAQYLWTGASKG